VFGGYTVPEAMACPRDILELLDSDCMLKMDYPHQKDSQSRLDCKTTITLVKCLIKLHIHIHYQTEQRRSKLVGRKTMSLQQ
jgi:hypothetical protein